ncbi:MAG: glycosyltransferase family 2 protein [Leptolyngbyaceae cyanobacterium RM2_2_4]|nr:glycosyltransferase family 2 protein [Leptolyngbyaceae cyanobacterium RM2_2_4]
MVDFTVAIPTYNGAQRLPDVLEALKLQTGTESFIWEVLVVDNNSQDTTAEVVKAYQQNSLYLIRYCLETTQGAGFARKRAIHEAKSKLIGFLDDDNIPAESWIAAAYAFVHGICPKRRSQLPVASRESLSPNRPKISAAFCLFWH